MILCLASRRVKQTRGAGGTQVGAAGLVGEDWWALAFHNPRAICLSRRESRRRRQKDASPWVPTKTRRDFQRVETLSKNPC